MLKFTVEAKSLPLLKNELRKLLMALTAGNNRPDDVITEDLELDRADDEIPEPTTSKEEGNPKRRGRPKRELNPTEPTPVSHYSMAKEVAKAVPEVQAPVETPKVAAPEPMKTLQRTDLAPYLTKVSEVKGIAEARTILGEFGAQRISELQEEHFEDFVKRCVAAVS